MKHPIFGRGTSKQAFHEAALENATNGATRNFLPHTFNIFDSCRLQRRSHFQSLASPTEQIATLATSFNMLPKHTSKTTHKRWNLNSARQLIVLIVVCSQMFRLRGLVDVELV
ncbi:hypothetical protein PsorP6_000710 [Peronosclerospora sorghi]|uniref:Uncharacterized protein n=1 Tax=Peronosclerospora sorghi TaxID=230839 RepID=A0ACC0WU84_9STRA|nr:hypothetical protein PsorP6_000710 [Peronosclerospora sorghi]